MLRYEAYIEGEQVTIDILPWINIDNLSIEGRLSLYKEDSVVEIRLENFDFFRDPITRGLIRVDHRTPLHLARFFCSKLLFVNNKCEDDVTTRYISYNCIENAKKMFDLFIKMAILSDNYEEILILLHKINEGTVIPEVYEEDLDCIHKKWYVFLIKKIKDYINYILPKNLSFLILCSEFVTKHFRAFKSAKYIINQVREYIFSIKIFDVNVQDGLYELLRITIEYSPNNYEHWKKFAEDNRCEDTLKKLKQYEEERRNNEKTSCSTIKPTKLGDDSENDGSGSAGDMPPPPPPSSSQTTDVSSQKNADNSDSNKNTGNKKGATENHEQSNIILYRNFIEDTSSKINYTKYEIPIIHDFHDFSKEEMVAVELVGKSSYVTL